MTSEDYAAQRECLGRRELEAELGRGGGAVGVVVVHPQRGVQLQRLGDGRGQLHEQVGVALLPDGVGAIDGHQAHLHLHRVGGIEVLAEIPRTQAQAQRAAIELQCQDQSYSEIADALDMTAKAAKSLLYRARNELRESLSPFSEALD